MSLSNLYSGFHTYIQWVRKFPNPKEENISREEKVILSLLPSLSLNIRFSFFLPLVSGQTYSLFGPCSSIAKMEVHRLNKEHNTSNSPNQDQSLYLFVRRQSQVQESTSSHLTRSSYVYSTFDRVSFLDLFSLIFLIQTSHKPDIHVTILRD